MFRFSRILFANYRRINNLRSHIEFEPKKIEMSKKFLISASIFSLFGFEDTKKIDKEEEEKEQSELIMNIKRGVLSSLRSEFDKAEQLYHLALRQAQTLQNDAAVTYIYDLLANLAYEIGEIRILLKTLQFEN